MEDTRETNWAIHDRLIDVAWNTGTLARDMVGKSSDAIEKADIEPSRALDPARVLAEAKASLLFDPIFKEFSVASANFPTVA